MSKNDYSTELGDLLHEYFEHIDVENEFYDRLIKFVKVREKLGQSG